MYALKLLVVAVLVLVLPLGVFSEEVPQVLDGLNAKVSLHLDSSVASVVVGDSLLVDELLTVDLVKLGLLKDVSVSLPVVAGLDAVNVLLV